MKKLRLLLVIFLTCISVPMVHVVYRTYQGLAQEEEAKLRFFADALFDAMEKEMAQIIWREEKRTVDEYSFDAFFTKKPDVSSASKAAALSVLPKEPYILGYIQNNPDGSFQTPLVKNLQSIPPDKSALVRQLQKVNTIFNNRKYLTQTEPPVSSEQKVLKKEIKQKGFADSYLSRSKKQAPKAYLGKKEKRVEKITVTQALNLSRQDTYGAAPETQNESVAQTPSDGRSEQVAPAPLQAATLEEKDKADILEPALKSRPLPDAADNDFKVEVAPFQSVFIDGKTIFIFRRVMIRDNIYRQGFVLNIYDFLTTLLNRYFSQEPMADFSRLKLNIVNSDRVYESIENGAAVDHARYDLVRRFPRPFHFIRAHLVAETLPKSSSRSSLNITMTVLVLVLLMGFTAVFKSMRTIVDLSERRSRFVSSVTHELKTPLTNIRMYIEMLQQGMAATPERQDRYLSILNTESSRLTRLINNVLELSRLEKKQRRLMMEKGSFDDVVKEVKAIMAPKLLKEDFQFSVKKQIANPFSYDREVMVQILVNLMENSIKFGRHHPVRHIRLTIKPVGDKTRILVSDTGPGIPPKSLKLVFDDFFRVEDETTDAVGGTGIGLALVKKFVTAMDGTVTASNNEGPGCTISILMPS